MQQATIGLLSWRDAMVRHANCDYNAIDLIDHRFPKDGPNPSQYFRGRDNDNRLVK